MVIFVLGCGTDILSAKSYKYSFSNNLDTISQSEIGMSAFSFNSLVFFNKINNSEPKEGDSSKDFTKLVL